MSESAKYSRARDICFNTETIFYHGTANSSDGSMVGMNYEYSGD